MDIDGIPYSAPLYFYQKDNIFVICVFYPVLVGKRENESQSRPSQLDRPFGRTWRPDSTLITASWHALPGQVKRIKTY